MAQSADQVHLVRPWEDGVREEIQRLREEDRLAIQQLPPDLPPPDHGFVHISVALVEFLQALATGKGADPPALSEYNYDSPIEFLFAQHLKKYLHPAAKLLRQVEVTTICGTFRLDFVLEISKQRIALECDGEEYHDARRDEFRDAMILGAGAVDSIYRLRGRDIYYSPGECLFIISRWNPELFSEAGIVSIERGSKFDLDSFVLETDGLRVIAPYLDESTETLWDIDVERRLLRDPPGIRSFWRSIYNYAIEKGGGDLDELMEGFSAYLRAPSRRRQSGESPQ